MLEFDPAAIAALAKRHLGLPPTTPDVQVPGFYIDELWRHLMLYPNEDNFHITLQPKVGLGTVTCLKNNCNEIIPMIRRVKARDGGINDGLGSLSAYRNHILSHNRTARIKPNAALEDAQSSTLPKDTVKQEPLPCSIPLDSPSCSSPTRPKGENPLPTNSSPVRVKDEPIEPRISRKRSSDIGITPVKLEPVGASELVVANPPKKQKTERLGKSPLAQVTNTPIPSTSKATIKAMHPPMDTFADLRLKLDDIQIAIMGQEYMLDKLLNSSPFTHSDIQAIDAVDEEMSRLRTLERSYQNAMGSENLATPPFFPLPQQPSFNYQSQNFPSSSYTDPPFDNENCDTFLYPPFEEEDHKPVINHHYPHSPSSSSPASSSTLASSHWGYQSSPGPGCDIKPSIHNFNSVPSSSKIQHRQVPVPHLPGDIDMDSDEDSDTVSVGPMSQFANPFIDGIKPPAPIYDGDHDENGDYHGRGRDLFNGPQAAPDDIAKFLIEAGNAESFAGNESVDQALGYLGLNTLYDKIPGMEISLMAHQAMGVAWMLEKEKSSLLGGCLADEMGLGKTVQMIACMVKNPSTNPNCKTNLVIAPLALLDQWKFEIEEKTSCDLKCLIYHGPSRTRRRAELLEYDVVLTTHNTMASEWPDYEARMKKKAKARRAKDAFIASDSDEEDMRNASYRSQKRKKEAGLLFQVEFFRISVDEGQMIRNRTTRMARAITDLRATYRWILTGTPIINSLADVYSYLRFLKVRPWYDWTKFHHDIGKLEKKNPTLAAQRLQKVMATFVLRRKKTAKLDGKNLVDLPEKEVVLKRLEFSEEEREIYAMVEARTQAKFNRFLRAGTVLKNYHQVLVLLLRLRQICSHASLIQEDCVAYTHADDVNLEPELATEMTRARRLVSSEFVDRMKAKLKQDALTRMEAEKSSANAVVEDEECPICYDVMTDAVVTPCTHIFCRDCILDVINRAPAMEVVDQNDKYRPCPVCRTAINAEKLFRRAAFEPSNEDLDPDGDGDEAMDVDDPDFFNKKTSKGKAKAKQHKRAKPRRKSSESDDEGDDVNDSGSEDTDDEDDDISGFIVQSDEDDEEKGARHAMKKRLGKKRAHIIIDSDDEPETPDEKEVIFGALRSTVKDGVPLMSRFLPSTKMKYMMDQLQTLAKTNPEEKTLIVSQWTGCLSLVSDYLTEKGIPHVKYQGDMNRVKRDQAVRVFMSREKARVMLMSLKCGGVGLNLTRANNVISLDLGWSQAVESQAYDRVHRLGQTRKVTVQRVVIADTVEDRILERQERKQMLADGSLGEGNGQKMGKLSVKELANLFGLDARGNRLGH